MCHGLLIIMCSHLFFDLYSLLLLFFLHHFWALDYFYFFNKYFLVKYFKYWCPRHTFDQSYFDFFQINLYNMNPLIVILEYKNIFRIFHDSFTLVCTCFFYSFDLTYQSWHLFHNIFHCKFSKTFNLIILNNVLCILLVSLFIIVFLIFTNFRSDE